jgi:hypothetical protein
MEKYFSILVPSSASVTPPNADSAHSEGDSNKARERGAIDVLANRSTGSASTHGIHSLLFTSRQFILQLGSFAGASATCCEVGDGFKFVALLFIRQGANQGDKINSS